MKHKLIILALVFSLVFVSQNTFSLGMGKIQVNSALDEPLNASIDIMANNDEAIDQVSVKLASADDYKKVGLDKSFVPAHIMVSVDEDNPYKINVTSNGPVSEPIVSLLLDVSWSNGRILREFTLLLDPPSYQTSTRGSVSVPVTESAPAEQTTETMADVQDDAVTVQSDDIPPVSQDLNEAYEESNVSEPAQDDTEFTVETPMDENVSESLDIMADEVYVNAGDTLWRIANQNKPGDVTTHQMMMAIYNNNPDAFLNNNVNEMIQGSTLQMPDADVVDDFSYQQALAEFESHNSRWATADDSYSSFQSESQADVDDSPTESVDYGVQLSGGEGDDTDSQQTQGDLADSGNSGLSDEEAYNASSENEELKSRVSELESIVDEQQSALELQDDDMANLEGQMAQANTEVDTLNEGGFDSLASEDNVDEGALEEDVLEDDALEDDALEDDAIEDDIWDAETTGDMTELNEDAESVTDDGLIVDEGEQATDLNEDDATAMSDDSVLDDDSVEDEPLVEESAVTTPQQPVQVDEPWYTSAINWIQQNILWVIIGLVVLFLIILLPRMFNRGDEDPAEESSFLDDIKSARDKKDDQHDAAVDSDEATLDEDDETVLTTPVGIDDDSDDDSYQDEDLDSFEDDLDDDSDDVLAELDNSLAFDDSDEDDDDDDFDFDFDDDEPGSDSDEDSDDDEDPLTGDLSDVSDYETPTKEYDPEPFKADDSFDDDFDLSELDEDDSDEDNDDVLSEDISEEETSDDDGVFDLEAELSELDDELDASDMDEDDDQSDVTVEDDDDAFSDDDFLSDLDEMDDEYSEDSDDDNEDLTDQSEEEYDEFEESLSLDEDDQATSFETEHEHDDMDDEDIDLGLDDLMSDGDVIETKLDLAKAYIEMGDTEGAKNLLDEVKAEGSEAQKSEADKLLGDM